MRDEKGRVEEIRGIRERLGTLPHQAKSVETRFFRGVEGIDVDLLDAPRNPYVSMFCMAVSTWGKATDDVANRWNRATPKDRFEVVRSVLAGQALPLALEAPKFAFSVRNLSRWSFDQLARARLGVVYASLGTRDNNHAEIPFRFHEATFRDPTKLKVAIANALEAKRRYGDFLASGTSSWQEARELLPISCVHRFVMAINYAALRGLCAKRMTFSEAEDTVAVAWLLRERLLDSRNGFPYLADWLRPRCDFVGACCYHRAHTASEAFGCLYRSCGRNPVKSAPGFPEVDYTCAEFNEACSDAGTIGRQLDIKIPGPDEDRPEGIEFEDLSPRDHALFLEHFERPRVGRTIRSMTAVEALASGGGR
jgi:hypothetical protein